MVLLAADETGVVKGKCQNEQHRRSSLEFRKFEVVRV
jgi:hypothetical protein